MCYTLSIGIYFALAPFPAISSTWNDESKHKLLQELLKIVDGFDVSPYDNEKTEVILDFKNLYLIYIK